MKLKKLKSVAKKQKSKYSVPFSTENVSENNLSWALIAILICSLIASVSTILICEYVLNSFQDSHVMVGLITDAGLIFDDKNLENNLSSATNGLKMAKDFGLALVIGIIGVGIALIFRIRRKNLNSKKPPTF